MPRRTPAAGSDASTRTPHDLKPITRSQGQPSMVQTTISSLWAYAGDSHALPKGSAGLGTNASAPLGYKPRTGASWPSAASCCQPVLQSGVVWQSTRGSITPWVVEVDRLGRGPRVAPASHRLSTHRRADCLPFGALYRRCREACRPSGIVLRQNWLRAYDFTTDRGAGALNDYARNDDHLCQVG